MKVNQSKSRFHGSLLDKHLVATVIQEVLLISDRVKDKILEKQTTVANLVSVKLLFTTSIIKMFQFKTFTL